MEVKCKTDPTAALLHQRAYLADSLISATRRFRCPTAEAASRSLSGWFLPRRTNKVQLEGITAKTPANTGGLRSPKRFRTT